MTGLDDERLARMRLISEMADRLGPGAVISHIPPETIGSVDPFYTADGAVGDVLKLAQYYATHEWETRIGQVPVARAVYDVILDNWPDLADDFRPVGRAVAR